MCSLHAFIGQLVVTVSPQPPESSWKSVLVRASCAFFPFFCRTARHRNKEPTVQPAYPCLCDLTVAQVRSLKITLLKNAQSNSRSGIVCNSGNLLNHKVHMHYSETNGAALSSSTDALPGEPVCSGHCLIADAADPPDYPSLPVFF